MDMFVTTEIIKKVHAFMESGRAPAAKYASVSKIIAGTSDQSGLLLWRKRVGEAEADRISKESAALGTSLHTILENHFSDGFSEEAWESEIGFYLYKRLIEKLKLLDPIALELKVWSDLLRVNGRLDCLGFYDGVLSIVDFKNSLKPKEDQYLEGYYIQATLYAMMLYDLLGIEVKQIVLLVALRNSPTPQVFVRRTNQYARLAYARVAMYYKQLIPAA